MDMVGCRIKFWALLALCLMAVVGSNASDVLTFESETCDLGTMLDTDSIRQAVFRFTNTSGKDVTISRVTTSCGCTVADFPSAPVLPHDNGTITLRYNPHNQIGAIDTEAFVYAGDSLVARLRLTGEVNEPSPFSHYRVQMGELRLRSATVRNNARGRQVERIACGNTSDKSITLRAMLLPPGVQFRTEPSVIPPHGEADIIITLDGCRHGKDVFIILDGISCPPSQRELKIEDPSRLPLR